MRTLEDLLNSSEGLSLLESKGIFVVQDDFIERLEVPANSTLTASLGLENRKPVYAAQQIYVDCTRSMLSRMAILKELKQAENVSPFFLWSDIDRAGSDPLTVKFFWPLYDQKKTIRVCPRAVEDMEPRFIPLDAAQLQQAMDTLEIYLVQTVRSKRKRARAKEKYEQFKAVFLQEPVGTLGEFNHRVVYFLLNNYADLNPPSVIFSDIINQDIITAEVNLFLNHLDDVISIFNEAVHSLIQQEIDPQVRPLAKDYLPLNYSCPVDHRRLKLYREIKGHDQFAVATCKCGENYRFYLGSKRLAIDQIGQTGRWSTDVCLVLFLNDLVSGYVAGKSSGIYYGLVMKEVLEKVLNKHRIPILLPESLGAKVNGPKQFDSLIYSYLTA